MRPRLRYDDIALEPFRRLPPGLWSRSFFRSAELINLLVDAAVDEVLTAIGIGLPDRVAAVARRGAAGDLERLAASCGVHPERARYLDWLLEWFGDARRPIAVVEIDAIDALSGDSGMPFSELARDAVRIAADVAPAVGLLERVTPLYPAFLRGERSGLEVLFAPGTLALWEKYFSNELAVVRATNHLAAHAVGRYAEGRDDLRVLEVGGGLGSAAATVLEGVGPRIARYLFTDVHPGFLRRGSARLRAEFPEAPVEDAVVDIQRPFAPQSAGGPFDVVLGVNVFHLAVDLLDVLGRARALLARGGELIIAEAIRPGTGRPVAAEFIFGLLPQLDAVHTDPEVRPRPGFLEWTHWETALRRAGFRDISVEPDFPAALDAYPNLAMAVFTARA